MNPVTVYDIAREANVSVSTVSRVLNGTAPVKNTTKRRVQSIIEKYQFQPNALARSLVKKTTGMIGVILPDIQNAFFPEVFVGAEEAARELGYTLFLCNSSGDFESESEYLGLLREKQVDGIIFMGGRINLARCSSDYAREVEDLSARIPVVLVNGSLPKTACLRIRTDEFLGTRLAIQHLIGLGHRDIGFLGGTAQTATTLEKLRAFKKTLSENGVPFRPEWVLHGSYSLQSGLQLMDRFLSMPRRPTAIFCINDYTAIGALKSALSRGARIPDDIAITGFDDTQLATAVTPELTTVSQNSRTLGRMAVEALHNIRRKEKVKRTIVLEPQLIVRESTVKRGTAGTP